MCGLQGTWGEAVEEGAPDLGPGTVARAVVITLYIAVALLAIRMGSRMWWQMDRSEFRLLFQ